MIIQLNELFSTF